MEWGVAILAVLALPVMGIIGFAKSLSNQGQLRRVEERLNRLQTEVALLSAKLAAAPRAAEPVSEPTPREPIVAAPAPPRFDQRNRPNLFASLRRRQLPRRVSKSR